MKSRFNAARIAESLPAWGVAFVFVAYLVISRYIPRVGDDVWYSHGATDLAGFLKQVNDIWLHGNGRTAISILCYGFLNLSFPRIILFAANAAFIAGLFVCVVKAVGIPRSHPAARLAIMLLVEFTLCWRYLWMEYACFINYVWPSVLALIILGILFRDQKRGRSSAWYWLLVPLALFTGTLHEALAICSIAGIPAYLNCTWRKYPPHRQLPVYAALMIGSLYPLTSPGRFSDPVAVFGDYSVPSLFLAYGYYIPILILAVTILAFRSPAKMKVLLASPFSFYLVSSIVSIPVIILAGYPGRPAWFGQLFALIALLQLFRSYNSQFPIPNSQLKKHSQLILSLLLFAIFAFHIGAIVRWQLTLSRECRQLFTSLEHNRAGVAYFDYTEDDRVPWFVRYYVRGVPDHDEYVNYLPAMAYGYSESERS